LHGIKRQHIRAYIPQQNGVAKRKNITLIGGVFSMFFHCGLPKIYLGKAIMIVNYFQNQSPIKALNEQITPYQSCTRVKPNLSRLGLKNICQN
jgi:hypothetical protein